MHSLALGNSHLSAKKPSDSGVVCCGVWPLWAKAITVFRACLGAQLTICAQKWRNFVLLSTVRLRFVLSRVCVFLGAKTIHVFRACLGAQLTICAQK